MRLPIVPPPKLLAAKLKLGPLPPRTPFRIHLDRVDPGPAAPREGKECTPGARPPNSRTPTDREEPDRELDSAARTATLLAPPPHTVLAPVLPPPSTAAPVAAQQLAVELVENAAFWGDGTRGVARLRFNGRARAGLANATITLEHDGDETHLRVEGIDPETEQHLRERLAGRGVTLSGET